MDAKLTLDGSAINATLTVIGKTGYGSVYLDLAAGAHHMTSDQKFGITISGIATFTS